MIPGVFFFCAVAIGFAAHLQASARTPGGDCGAFWAQVLDRLCLWIALPLLVVSSFHTVGFVARPLSHLTQIQWLLAAGLAWIAVLVAGSARPPAPETGRWLAGAVEFSPQRHWVLLFLIPLLPALFFTTPPWTEDIYAAHWAILAVFIVSVIGLSLSASPTHAWTGPGDRRAPPQHVVLSPWPEEMRSRGIGLELLTAWERSPDPEPATGLAAEWLRWLLTAGSPGVSGILCGAISRLTAWKQGDVERAAIVLAPDDCGQEEVTALVATELSRRHGESTLLITASPDPELAARLDQWLKRLGGETPAQLTDLTAPQGAALLPGLYLADAETLSDTVLDRLRAELEPSAGTRQPAQGLGRIGLVVWWNAHEFSGVLASHVWAVSRRLERLLKLRRGVIPRAAVFARRPREREAAFLRFLEHLLPYAWSKDNQYQIPADVARRTSLYRLEDTTPESKKKAAEASLLTDWPTLAPADALPAVRTHAPAPSAASAGARILDLRPDEVLSLREIVCQGGRASAPGLEHHAAVAASDNPYVDFLLSRYRDQASPGASMHLVGAVGHPELVRRHLLLALREVPDTLTELRSTFRWEEGTLRETLRRLSNEDRLSRIPVRFLDSSGRLQRDSRYANQNPGQSAVRSFRVVGRSAPVELRDPNVRNRLLLQIDPERLPIEAYPKRVFQSHGRRYRVQSWPSQSPERIDCLPEESAIRTWPSAASRISAVRPRGEALSFRGVMQYTANVLYHEHVSGIWERDASGAFHTVGINPVKTSFETEALILEFAERFGLDQLVVAAAVLQHVVPVHAAIEDTAIRIVPMPDAIRPRLALVDLYPGGMGIVGAMHSIDWLLPAMFDQVVLWLSSIRDAAAAHRLCQSPILRTLNITRIDVGPAVRVFQSAAMQASIQGR